MSSLDSQRLIFVGGLHRSGTTALGRILADHPEISGFRGTGVVEDEGQHLQSVYRSASHYGGPGRFALHPAAHLTEDFSPSPGKAGQLLLTQWSPHWDLSRPFLVEKSPPNLIMGRFLQAAFPGSALIVIVRHPVVVSLSTKKWARFTTLAGLVRHWFAAHDLLRRDSTALSRLMVLRYEDLIANPIQALAHVTTFLGLSSALHPARIESTRSNRYVDAWDGMATGTPTARWKRRQIIRQFRARVGSYGYDVEDLNLVAPWHWPGTE